MLEVIFQMAGLIICGVGWRWLHPAGLAPAETRTVLTALVYYLLLPALVLSVLWKAELGESSVLIATAAAVGIFAGLAIGFLSCRLCRNSSAEAGAVILAITFPNATYLGLPVLEATFGPWARGVAIQYDLFACTPLLFTVGVLVAARLGASDENTGAIYRGLLRIPAMWAALAAVALNVADVPLPSVLDGLLTLLERGVVPLMLFSLGLSLEWSRSRWRLLPSLVPVVVVRLLLVPLIVMFVAGSLGMSGELRAAVVMEAAMPSMVLGLVLCDRFKLDVGLYAAAVTVTTALSMVTLPLWFAWLSA
ncbi:AEC family transporter [Sulfuriflexus sp.]|uniref:AEC family transporter n=1 Tax=Sulfuriflexus sp. TaxID=2015443 RepID=UPI0028CEFD93|nr:AEC family transporter [Sulfuriflexus sp.]MDT8405214.1 AEC family transporter [Sulfuriflexus sp.]